MNDLNFISQFQGFGPFTITSSLVKYLRVSKVASECGHRFKSLMNEKKAVTYTALKMLPIYVCLEAIAFFQGWNINTPKPVGQHQGWKAPFF